MFKDSSMQVMLRDEISFVLENDVDISDRDYITDFDKKRVEQALLDRVYQVIDSIVYDELEKIIESKKEEGEEIK
jgi:hypothetical protein